MNATWQQYRCGFASDSAHYLHVCTIWETIFSTPSPLLWVATFIVFFFLNSKIVDIFKDLDEFCLFTTE